MEKKQLTNIIISVICVGIGIADLILVYRHIPLWLSIALWATLLVVIIALLIGIIKQMDSLYRLSIMCLYAGIFCVTCYTVLVFTGIIDKFDSAESFKYYINNGPAGAVLFVVLSFLQVTFIPLPSSVVVVAGTLIFGFWKGFILSLIGQVAGSIVAFLLGRKFGVKLVIWIIGEEAYTKYRCFAKGRDKVVLGYMILFPAFPDDIICLLLGLTNMRKISFLILILISRPITIASTGLLTEYIQVVLSSGTFGLITVSALVALGAILLILSWKYGEQIEKSMLKIMDMFIPKKYRAVAEDPDALNAENPQAMANTKEFESIRESVLSGALPQEGAVSALSLSESAVNQAAKSNSTESEPSDFV